ncbi:hypothetical protein Tco_0730672 [Tanacetum coccineum]|uniref:Mitochondrial protein n=1 Tax=Tanacetum coccineum TaxID=301880 RepID=A0ABQ4YUZ3_9ASTR
MEWKLVIPLVLQWRSKIKLDLDQNGTPVDATKYRSMIGALKYLTSSEIETLYMLLVLCGSWFRLKPTEMHLKEVKRIFRYLWGTVNMGLWYTKDSGFELTGFLDADYAGCKDTFKSTSGGAQFLGEKLVSWSSKKQRNVQEPSLQPARPLNHHHPHPPQHKTEYVSLSLAVPNVLWDVYTVKELRLTFHKFPI